MRILIHYPYLNAAPEGVWWFDGSATLRSYYVPEGQSLQIVGARALRSVMHRADEFELEEVYSRLAERPPYPDDWDVTDISDKITPQEFLALSRKAVTRVKAAA